MAHFLLEYLGFHQIAYAHALTVNDYRFSFSTDGFGNYRPRQSDTSGVMEIGYVVKNPLVIENHTLGEIYTAEEGDIFLFPPGHEVSVHAQNTGEHKHITAEFMIDARVTVCREPAPALPPTPRQLLLPYVLPSSAGRLPINRIHKIAADYTLLTPKSYFEQCSEFCALLEALRRTSDPGELTRPYLSLKYRAHCRQAEEYIEKHLSQRISIQEIANEIGISKNYLINIFSQYKGIGLTEYINRVKLNRIVVLISRYGYSLRRSCEYVGYTDVNYVSRIFRKYYGVTLREYFRMSLPSPENEAGTDFKTREEPGEPDA